MWTINIHICRIFISRKKLAMYIHMKIQLSKQKSNCQLTMKKWSTSLVTKELQIKTISFSPSAFFNEKKKITSIGKDTGNKTALGITGQGQPLWRAIWQSLTKAGNVSSYDLANPFWEICPGETLVPVHTYFTLFRFVKWHILVFNWSLINTTYP